MNQSSSPFYDPSPSRRTPLRDTASPFATKQGLRDLVAHLQHAREEEHRQILHTLNHQLLPQLFRLNLELHGLLRLTRPDPSIHGALAGSAQHARAAVDAAARVLRELELPVLEHCGLHEAIRFAASIWEERQARPCHVRTQRKPVAMTTALSLEIFRLFEDAVISLTPICGVGGLETELSRTPQYHRLKLRTTAKSWRERERIAGCPAFLSLNERSRRLGGRVYLRCSPTFVLEIIGKIPIGAQTLKLR